MSLLIYLPHAPSRNTCLCTLRALCTFVSYAPTHPACLADGTYLRALRVLLSHLTCLTDAPYFRALRIFLGWVCSLSKTFNFPRTIKGTTNYVVFRWVEKHPRNFFGIYLFIYSFFILR